MCVCLSRCLSGRCNYEGLVPHKQYFADISLAISSCVTYVIRTHDVLDDVTRSNFEIAISPLISQLDRRSKARNIGNAYSYIADIFNHPIKKYVAIAKWRPFSKR